MMQFFRHLFLVTIMTLASVAMANPVTPTPPITKCADFLTLLHMKPAHVQFVKCELSKDQQGKPLRAIYRVTGAHAVEAENFLVRLANLPRLKKSCCQWDGPPSHIAGKDGRSYTVYMMSPETHITNRKKWRNISNFEIVVETLTEEI